LDHGPLSGTKAKLTKAYMCDVLQSGYTKTTLAHRHTSGHYKGVLYTCPSKTYGGV